MKKLLAGCLVLFGMVALMAAEPALLSKVPASTAGAVFFNVKALMQSEDCAKFMRESFWTTGKNATDCGVEELLIFTTSKPKLINAAMVRLSRPLDLVQSFKQHNLVFTSGAIAGKRAYFVQQAMLCDELTVVELEPTLYLLASSRHDAERLSVMTQGVPELVTPQMAKLTMPDAPIWYVDTGLKLPVRSKDAKKKNARSNVRLCFDPFVSGNTGKFRLIFECPDASTASQMAVLVPVTSGVVCGVLFSEDPSLNERVLARIVPKIQGNDFCVEADIPADLMQDIHTYFKERDFVRMIQSAIDLVNL